MTIYLTNLEQLAADKGIRVRLAPVPAGLWGIYEHKCRLITIKPSLGQAQYVSTLAHELGHARYGHTGHQPKTEYLADKWAAMHLLTVDLIKEHSEASMEASAVAASLGVLPWVVRAFIKTLTFEQGVDLMNHTAEHHA